MKVTKELPYIYVCMYIYIYISKDTHRYIKCPHIYFSLCSVDYIPDYF